MFSSCAPLKTDASKTVPVRHVYITPVVNRTPYGALDITFTRAANDVFYSDPRFLVDKFPIPNRTLLIRSYVLKLSKWPVGFDSQDRATEYRVEVLLKVRIKKAGYKKAIASFTVRDYAFYSAPADPQEAESRFEDCVDRLSFYAFRDVAERVSRFLRKGSQ